MQVREKFNLDFGGKVKKPDNGASQEVKCELRTLKEKLFVITRLPIKMRY